MSAFFPGRLLARMCFSLLIVKGYSLQRNKPKAMLKFYLKIAFNYVRKDFIMGALKAFSIPSIFIGWVEQFISKPTFLVLNNGKSGVSVEELNG